MYRNYQEIEFDFNLDLYTSHINLLTWISDELRLLCIVNDKKRKEFILKAKNLPVARRTDND